jgi:calpain
MGCSAEGGTENKILVKGEESGIMSGHAYGIIDVFELKDEECTNYHKSRRLIRLKNPWGYGEW